MIEQKDLLSLVKTLVEQRGSLKTKNIVVQGDQILEVKVGTKFSFKQWLNNITPKNFGLENGHYPIFGRRTFHNNACFIMLELAPSGPYRMFALTTPAGKPETMIVREVFTFTPFQYTEVTQF